VKPEFALCELKGLPAQRLATAVSDEDVERELESVRQRQAQFVEEAEGVAAATGHLVTMAFEGRIDGVLFEGGTAKDVTVELGSGQLIPGFDEQLVGALAGEARSVRVRFPDDYAKPDLAGKDAEFQVRVGSLRRREVPALDDEFAKDLGGDFENLDQVRAKIRESLVASRERASRATLRRTLLDAVIERVPSTCRRSRRGTTAAPLAQCGAISASAGRRAAVDRQLARWEHEWRPLIEREVREEWLLAEVARVQEIAVDDAEVEARLARMAEEQGTDAAKLRKAYREAGALEAIRGQLLEEKAVEFLLGEAKVEELAAS
jgi:trigger factor